MKRISLIIFLLILCMIPQLVYARDLIDPKNPTCEKCGETLSGETIYRAKDDTIHQMIVKCSNCGEENVKAEYEHMLMSEGCEQYNGNQHRRLQKCLTCNHIVKTPEDHYWSNMYTYEYADNGSHYHLQKCYSCQAERKIKEPHDLSYVGVTREASLFSNGETTYKCWDCGCQVTETFPWQYDGAFSTDYDLDHTQIYRKSKSVKVYLRNGLKGGVIKLKIGKKTYTKKLKDNSTTVKIKIKKPKKYGQKVKLTLLYNGQVVGKDDCSYWDVVWYAKKVKVGMTKKQAKYTWGVPYRKIKSSRGFEHWHWRNGDYLRFRNGRLDYWSTSG